MNARDYWNAHYRRTNLEMNPNLNIFESIFNKYQNQIFSPVLDLGCGEGKLLNFLNQRGIFHLVGVDISDVAISLAKKEYPGINFLVGDIYNLKNLFEKNFFSFITSSRHYIIKTIKHRETP